MNTEILPPTHCPACNGKIRRVNNQLFCVNPGCLGSISKKLEHYCKTLKIKGLGPKTIEKLDLQSIFDIYELDESIFDILGEKTGSKILLEVENSYSSTFTTFLAGLGIPLIGKSATSKLSSTVSCIDDITEKSCKAAGLGNVATGNLLEWLEENDTQQLRSLASRFSSEPTSVKPTNLPAVCISGKLKSFKTKQEAKLAIEELGFKVTDTVTKDTQYLLTEQANETSKVKKAREKGIKIVNYEELINEQPTT